MTSNTIVATKKFTVDLTKAELDAIHKQFLEELDEMLDKVRTTTTREESGREEKSYCNTIVRDNVTVTLSLNKNKINKINNNLINNNNLNKENTVNVTVTISCLLLLHYLFSTF